jgi:diketogulonate reductase-like aldo/keto reductase
MSNIMTVPGVKLHNGVAMPQFGLGVWQAEEGAEVEQAVSHALEIGYRLIDTAAVYHNESGVGKAIRESGIPRKEIFVTTKLWNDDQGYDSTLTAYDASLKRLGMDYVDLYLIHWPRPKAGKFIETWQAFEKLYADKRIRAIGVSNFKPAHLEELLTAAKVVPMVNQIELHPKLQQLETRNFCKEYNIAVESYSPIMRGSDLLNEPTLVALANTYNKTPAQIVLRWHIQSGLIAIPKSVTPARIEENMRIFDFELSQDDMKSIDDMNADRRIGMDPDNF